MNSVRRKFCSVYLEDPSYFEGLNRDTLLGAEFAIMADSINIYNMNGESVLHSTLTLDYDKETVKKKIREVSLAMWSEDYYLGKIESSYNDYQYQEIVKIIKDKQGREYLVEIKMSVCSLPEHLQENTIEETLRKVTLSNGGFAFPLTRRTGHFPIIPIRR